MNTPVEDLDPMPDVSARDWRYWRTPVLFGAGFCALQVALFSSTVRLQGCKHGWSRRLDPGPLWPRPILHRWLVGRVARSAAGSRMPRCVADLPACGDCHSHSLRHRVQLGGWVARPPLCSPLCTRPVSSVGRDSRTDPKGMVVAKTQRDLGIIRKQR